MGNLNRLFVYSKTGVDAKEDFTTEALAIAIRHDPRPFVEAMRAGGLLPDGYLADDVTPFTQSVLPAVGRIDLVIQLARAGVVLEHWVEVKVDAPESGNQLDRYRAHLATIPADLRPTLVTLSRRPIRKDGALAWLPWQVVYRAAVATGGPHWSDFAEWLEEIGMASTHETPLTTSEMEALGAAERLYRKLTFVLADVALEARTAYPLLSWPGDPKAVGVALRGQFEDKGRFTLPIGVTPGRMGLFLGAWIDEGATQVGMWVETNPKYGPQRRRLLQAADEGGLSTEWERRYEDWRALTTVVDLGNATSQSEVVAWYVARLRELSDSGVLALLHSLFGKSAPVEDEMG